jgi:outer membrane receptor for ferrienterochelin and colicin
MVTKYKNREISGEKPLIPRPPHSLNRRLRWAATNQASQTAGSQDATSQITAYETASSQATSQSQQNSRNRGPHHEPAPLPLDELEIYLREPVIDSELF